MKVFVFVLMFIGASKAREFVTIDETETLFKKFVLNDLTEEENATLQDLFEILRFPEYVPVSRKQQHVDYPRTRTAYTRNIECIVCRSAFSALFEGIANGQSDEELIESISTLCLSLGIQNKNVCDGVLALNLPIINYIIRTTPEATPHAFCGLLSQTAHSDVCPHNDQRFEWMVELPAEPQSVAEPQIEERPLKVAIVTDAHIDPLYEAYGVAECDEPTCCRKGQTPRSQGFRFRNTIDESLYERTVIERSGEKILNLSIAPEMRKQRSLSYHRIENRRNAAPAGYWGDYRDCDTPLWAYDDVIDRIAEAHTDIDMVYYIGDTIDHGVWETTYHLIDEMNRYLIEKMRSAFGEHVLVIPTIGNHEAQPTNQFAPNYVIGELNTTWLYEALANKWGPYLTADARASLLERGDFSVRPRPGLKVIAINNNVAYRNNWWLVFDPLDAKRHLDWLIQELYESELAGEKVHILAHIPPGVHDLTHTWTREYNRIVNRFTSTIAAEFNGHVHSDQFKLFYSSTDGSPISVAWGGGGATAYSNYNLNYKIVYIDSSSFEPTSMQCYTYNVTEANLTPNRRPHWFQLYDMKNSFDLPDLSPASIDTLEPIRMQSYSYNMTKANLNWFLLSDLKYSFDLSDLSPVYIDKMSYGGYYLNLYSAYFSKLSDGRWPQCDQEYKINNLCNIVITVLWDREKCEEITGSLFAKARYNL